MNKHSFFNSFRIRLLTVLAILLISTLSVQYYLNLRTEEESNRRREQQSSAIIKGMAVAFKALASSSPDDYLSNLVVRENQPALFDERTGIVANILLINNNWQIYDSVDPKYAPDKNAAGEAENFLSLSEAADLPPLVNADELGEDRARFPNVSSSTADAEQKGEAHAISFETDQGGKWYAMIVLRSDRRETFLRAGQPLIYTFGVSLLAILAAAFLVWQFTRPIADLSEAARLVAEGDLGVRVPVATRRDEMGRLAARFNEMVERLEKSRELEAQLQQAEKSAVVGRLASAIAHEIRNPLNYINLTLDHLRVKFAPDEPDKREVFSKLATQLKTEIGRINNQVSGFLNYSRPTKLNLEPTDVTEIVESALDLIDANAKEQNIKIEYRREDVPPIFGDAAVLRSVFNNLLINAMQAMDASGGGLTVSVESEAFSKTVCVTITDTGCGIAPENLGKIFEPYFSTKETGTGLGLAIVKKIVEDHNGTIAVESTPNIGTTFIVRLPQTQS